MSDFETRSIEIVNERGLHARASAKVVELTEGYDCEAYIRHDGETADAASIMDLLGLAAQKGVTVTATAEGPQAIEFLDALANLFASRFGEEK